jgi:hypothetical protein
MKKTLLSIAIIGLLAVHAKADVLASYPFDSSSRASTDSDINTSASVIADGSGLVSTVDATRGNPSPSISIASDQTDGTSNATAVAANDYVSFTLTPLSGATFSLTSLALDAANWSTTSTFPSESYFLRSSLDSFGANVGTTQSIASGSNGAITPNSFDLTGAAFQNLSAPIEFRLYVQDSTTNAGRGILFDNIILNGTTTGAAIPEPATWLLMGVGLLVGAQRLRRRS